MTTNSVNSLLITHHDHISLPCLNFDDEVMNKPIILTTFMKQKLFIFQFLEKLKFLYQ